MQASASRIRLRPNRHTLVLGAMLITMWYASAAQQNGGAYVLLFLIASIAIVSLLHARANLRSVQLLPGVPPPLHEGTVARVPLVLSVSAGAPPCGLEITANGVRDPVFIEQLTLDHPTRTELRVPVSRQAAGSLSVVVRSLYPLGFFTAERVMEVPQARVVLPSPSGDLPLPSPYATGNEWVQQTQWTEHSSEPDDFSGVRAWQPGDSLRHIDWKAVARGRPLMVKQWSGAVAGAVWLDWSSLFLPDQARRAQLAQWIDTAEQRGLNYGLKTPDLTLAPSQGSKHRLLCLQALAVTGEGQSESLVGVREGGPPVPSTRETTTAIPGRPLLWLGVVLLLTALPVVLHVPMAGSLAVLLGLLLRWRCRHPISLGLKLLPVILAIGGSWLQLQTLKGLEPGVAILLGVTAAKFVEARTPRDFQLLALLGWFLCLCGLALDQAFGRSLWAYLVFLLMTLVLVRFRRGSTGLWLPLRTSGVLLLQTLPLVAVLFFLFPRGSASLVQRLNRTMLHQSGLSDQLNPGSVARIAQSQDKAFWVKFPQGKLPGVESRYWRCLVLNKCNGLTWERGAALSDQAREPASVEHRIWQEITLMAHGGNWLPALDRPTVVLDHHNEHYLNRSDDSLNSISSVDSLRKYRVASLPLVKFKDMNEDARQTLMQKAPQLSPQVRALAAGFAREKRDRQIVEAALQHFRTQGYEYSIEPGEYDPQRGLDQFLFERKRGFCEHYAAAFATLMREAGLPSRVVIGYLGGEYSERIGYITLRQADAHAWTEVWLEGQGWERVDPTAALIPARLSNDLRTLFESGAEGVLAQGRNRWWGEWLQQAATISDHLNYWWYDRVVQFDEQEQTDLWQTWGLLRLPMSVLLAGGLGLLLLPLVLIALWLRRRTRHPDPVVRLWQRFCARLARQGIVRASNEGPLDFAARAARARPAKASEIEQIASLYAAHRYGSSAVTLRALRHAMKSWSA